MEKYHFEPHALILVTGVPGSGKRTLVNGLNEHIQVFYIDSEPIKNRRTTLREGDFYEKAVRRETYIEIDSRVTEHLEEGDSILVRATYSTEVQNPNWVQRYVRMIQNFGAGFRLIRCVAPEDEIRRRIEERGYERDKPKLADWKGFIGREPIHVPMPEGSLELDTSLEKYVEVALNFLKNRKIS